MRTLLICHHDAPLHQEGLARWMASFSTLAGILVVREGPEMKRKRLKRETKRVGRLRILDVLAFQLWYRATRAAADTRWKAEQLDALRRRYPAVPADVPVLEVRSPNSPEAERFVRECAPDMTIALVKWILKESVFAVPPLGTWVMHPGICPEYRNAHGCFWALAERDVNKVGMTLLRIDRGIDTGPTYGYFTYPYDEVRESHVVIQTRVVLDNLDAIRARLEEVARGEATPLHPQGRPSAEWGQPWLTRHLAWKLAARRSRRARARAAVS